MTSNQINAELSMDWVNPWVGFGWTELGLVEIFFNFWWVGLSRGSEMATRTWIFVSATQLPTSGIDFLTGSGILWTYSLRVACWHCATLARLLWTWTYLGPFHGAI